MPKILAVTGPTASGKSDLALRLAETFRGEIVSCDSMQIYRGMDIGTAKPKPAQLRTIRHHMIDIFPITERYSVCDYVKAAEDCVTRILQRGALPILCGGTGLYLDSFLSSAEFCEQETLPQYRALLERRARDLGGQYLLDELSRVDSESAQTLHPSDIKRMIRALEVYRSTGKPISEWKAQSKLTPPKYRSLVIGLKYERRAALYDRIDERVDLMLEQGLAAEAKSLFERGLADTPTAGQAIGYKELYPYFSGESSLAQCVQTLKQNSRRYAKRQMTWFGRNRDIAWITRDNKSPDEVFDIARDMAERFLAES